MAIAIRAKQGISRRHLLVRSASTIALAGLAGLARPYLSRAADRPQIAGGVASGDVSTDSAVVWARADRPARMRVECSSVESFKTIICAASSDALPESDFTSKVLLGGLPSGQDIFYRVRFEDLALSGISGEAQVGHFRTAPADKDSISFVWSGDTAGQGWGIDASRGGMRTYRAMLENRPDFFIHSGDHIYADCPIWNKRDDPTDAFILGAAQLAWLKRELAASDATWKVIAADLPIGLISEDAIALGNGPPERREHEIADLLSFIKRAGVSNVVWLTADMHYTAAHYYDPNRAVFQDFEPFWEFVSGPLHAGTWAPGELDNTFGPAAVFQKGCSAQQGENLAPCFGLQFFGRVDIDGHSGIMTVTLKDVDDRALWSVDIEPRPDARPGRILAQHI
jgi:phosphodiesterase/alkaline phosphatase D-like protein